LAKFSNRVFFESVKAMLTGLDIQSVILIDRISLAGDAGLVALTGETGAGKSILLDALGLALGARAEASFVRHGAELATVTATFDLPARHPLHVILTDKGISAKDGLILRRTIGRDGRSKAFINDAPVSVQLLKETGQHLIEIHGQFETQGLLDPQSHGATLDGYAGIDTRQISAGHAAWKSARDKLSEAEGSIEAMKLQEAYLRHVVRELEELAPEKGEEDILAEKRRILQTREKMSGAYDAATDIIESGDGLRAQLARLQIALQKLEDKELSEAAARAIAEIDDLSWQIEKRKSGGDKSGDRLEDIEERYFALREAAKKHRVSSDDLPDVLTDIQQKLRLITHRDDALAELQADVKKTKAAFMALAEKASAVRKKAAEKMAKAVNIELPPLKLDKAKVFVECTPLDEKDWNDRGMDRVQFTISTNPNTPAGPLHKIASGGELSRFMLALKVILAETGSVPTLIFDEVDSGIGGATADAVGERLQKLAKNYQVLVVTHSPQVAARAAHHWHVAKTEQKGTVVTRINPLKEITDRTEEIARMLSGAEITAEARAQAAKLLKNKDAA
jgi:DNA repair protein RecN (Recombination protein N)